MKEEMKSIKSALLVGSTPENNVLRPPISKKGSAISIS